MVHWAKEAPPPQYGLEKELFCTMCVPSKPTTRLPRALAAGLVLLLALALCPTAWAAGGLEMSTPYPGVSAKAGETLEFSLDFYNASGSGASVALSVSSIPQGWSGYFQGDGSQISHVYAKSGDNDDAAVFRLTLPDDAAQGTYTVGLLASGGGLSSSLTLTLTVGESDLGGSSLSTEYAEQEGASGTSFTFQTTIQNDTAKEQSYSFSSDPPTGWTVAFQPSGETTQVAAITVDARGSQTMDVVVTPPEGVDAGSYTIPISAISATETLSSELTVVITGTYALDLSTPSGLLSFDASANAQTDVTLQVTNTGNVDLQNVNLSSSAPDGWTVEFSASSIEVLEAGATQEVTAYVTPSGEAMSGDYVLTLSAENSQTSDSAEFRVSVKTQTVWGVVGILLIVAVAAGLGVVFRKYGRR